MKENKDEELVTMVIRIPKYKKEMIKKLAKKQERYESEIIRSAIDKELKLDLYQDNLEEIIKKILKPIEEKQNKFINSQRKINAKYLRTSAINTYLNAEIMNQLFSDDFNEKFRKMLKKARKKANCYVSKDTTNMEWEDLFEFYNIGDIYRDEYRKE